MFYVSLILTLNLTIFFLYCLVFEPGLQFLPYPDVMKVFILKVYVCLQIGFSHIGLQFIWHFTCVYSKDLIVIYFSRYKELVVPTYLFKSFFFHWISQPQFCSPMLISYCCNYCCFVSNDIYQEQICPI